MQYTTTSCRNCGFRTRSHESNVPDVQIGCPVLRCPRCGHLILDSIATEYEFMTSKEREKMSTSSAVEQSYLGNLVFIIFGALLLIGGLVTGEGYVGMGLLFGGALIALGISQIVKNQKTANENIIEQAIYESLQRTQNEKYVKFIQESYNSSGIDRDFKSFANRTSFLKQYSYFESRRTYMQNMQEFDNLMKLIYDNPLEESNISTFTDP